MPRKQTNKQHLRRNSVPADYASLLADIKHRIRTAQVRAAFSANAELIRLYWDIGRAIEARQRQEGWGRAVIPRLARDLHNEMPEVKGFSERNLRYMVRFYREYDGIPIVQQAAAQLPSAQDLTSAPEILPQAVAKSDQIRGIVPHVVAQLP